MEIVGGILSHLADRVSPLWILGIIILWLLLDRSGLVPAVAEVLRARTAAKEEHNRRAEDREQKLLATYEGDAEKVRRWWAEDRETHLAEITRLRETLNASVEQGASSERGNARLRHALASALQHIGILRRAMQRASIEPPRFEGLDDLLRDDPVIGEDFRRILEGKE